jgi:hypothetical protein
MVWSKARGVGATCPFPRTNRPPPCHPPRAEVQAPNPLIFDGWTEESCREAGWVKAPLPGSGRKANLGAALSLPGNRGANNPLPAQTGEPGFRDMDGAKTVRVAKELSQRKRELHGAMTAEPCSCGYRRPARAKLRSPGWTPSWR